MRELVATHGAKKWSVIAGFLPGRIGKQCRERWHNNLNPAIVLQAWTEEEDRIILEVRERISQLGTQRGVGIVFGVDVGIGIGIGMTTLLNPRMNPLIGLA